MKLPLNNSSTFLMEKTDGTREGRQKKKTLGTPDEIGKPKSKPEEFEPLPIQPRREKIGSPAFLPADERKHYDKIQGLRERFLRRLVASWSSFKREYLATLEKQTREQRVIFNKMLDDFNEIASDSFTQGVAAGNNYYEDQFSARGLSSSQQRRVVRQHASVFQDRAKGLFFDDASNQLRDATVERQQSVLDGFDRFLLGYANVVGSIAYDVFSRNITGLNLSLFKVFSAAGRIFPREAVKVQWVLFEDAEHSSDCLRLAEGEDQDGSGLWDARALSEMGLVPRSPNLDCGGNCKCHLSPIVPLPEEAASWLDNITTAPFQRDILGINPNISQLGLRSLLGRKGFGLPSTLLDDLIKRPSFRRREFWNQIPNQGFNIGVTRGPAFSITGSTDYGATSRLRAMAVDVVLGPGQQLSTLTKSQLDEIARVLAHELGHTFASIGPSKIAPRILGAHGLGGAREILQIARKERAVVLAQIENNFQKVVRRIPKDRLTELKPSIDIASAFIKNPEEFLDDLFSAVADGRTFGGVPADEAMELLNRALHEFSTGTQIVRSYQLWDAGEYFADWFSLLLVDPSRAALYSANLNRGMAKSFPSFFKKLGVKNAKQIIPDAVAATQRIDLPLISAFEPIAPNLKTFGSAAKRFESATNRIATSTIQREISQIVKNTPALHRQEFYRGLSVDFLDKLQTANRTGSRRTTAFFDRGKFFVNYDRWRLLSEPSKATVLSDVVSRHIWQTARSPIRTRIRGIYTDYLENTLNFVENKASIQNLSRRPVEDIRDVVLGNRSKSVGGVVIL